ncbi:hypothetical protein B0T20DRAFT_484152 [Sordaria brevicollis]|uniref:Uncharacterized protein n=1 Tax=Sordaria brevicollis TaxID=83679 RepID=A0AAE0NVX2_SORBR|nr:hypothetical protein B0T20DRAFT_484152 [Sordaria brevicollis]
MTSSSQVKGKSQQNDDDSSEVISSSPNFSDSNNNKHNHHHPRAANLCERRTIPARDHERRGVSSETRSGRARGMFSSIESEEDWRVLSRPRQRRLSSRFGRVLDTIATREQGSQSFLSSASGSNSELSPSSLRARFLALDQAAVKASIEEHVTNVEAELEKLKAEREQILRELEEEDEEDVEVEEQWEEGVRSVDEFMGL